MSEYRYYVTQACSCPDSPQEHEVSKADYMMAERNAGFRSKFPGEPATASFSSSNPPISGRTERVTS
jgi:hypothetical protein